MNSDVSVRSHRPKLQVVTFEDFKKNCGLLEDALASEGSDPLPDLEKLWTWINWIDGKNGTPDHEDYFYRVAIPRITKALLRRRFPDERRMVPKINAFFQGILERIARKFSDDMVELHETLMYLFDPRQTYYMLYGRNKQYAMPYIAEGTLVEVRSDDGVVYKGTVKEESQSFRQEIYIELDKTKQLVWVPIFSVVSMKAGSAKDAGVRQEQIEVDDNRWRDNLRPGSLIDFQDTAGSWYQAVVVSRRLSSLRQSLSLSGTGPKLSQPESFELYVAMYGHSSKTDEWVSMTSERISPRNSKSAGRRGPGHIRSDIGEPVDDSKDEKNSIVMHRERANSSILLVSNVDLFGRKFQGFSEIRTRLSRSPPVPIPNLYYIVGALSNLHQLYTRRFAHEYIPRIKQAVTDCITGMTEKDLRSMTKEGTALLFHFERLLNRVESQISAAQAAERLWLKLAETALSSPALELRLHGIRMVNEAVDRVVNYRHNPTGYELSPVGGYFVVRQVPVVRWITAARLCQWARECKLLENIFVGPMSHEQLMRRIPSLLRFMGGEERLIPADIDLLWDAAQGSQEHRITVYHVLEECVGSFDDKILAVLMGKLREVPPNTYSTHTLSLLKALALCHSELSLPANSPLSYEWYGRSDYVSLLPVDLAAEAIKLVWQTTLDNVLVVEAISKDADLKLKEILESEHCRYLRRYYMELAVSNLKNGYSVPQSIGLISHCYQSYSPAIRSVVAKWLKEEQKVVDLFFKDLLRFKSDVKNHIRSLNKLDLVKHRLTAEHSMEVENIVTTYFRTQGGIFSYIQNITIRLEFLQQTLSSGASLGISKEQILSLWNNLNLDAYTLEEQNCVLSWFTIASEGLPGGEIAATSSSDQNESRPDSELLSMDDASWFLFNVVLSNRSFLCGPDLTVPAFACLQRFFRLVNQKKGLIEELPGDKFQILAHNASLLGVEDFWTVSLHGQDSDVVAEAIRFLTTLPQKLRVEEQKHVTAFHKRQVEKCMFHLQEAVEEFNAESHNSSQVEERVRRCLIILKTIMSLDEAYLHASSQRLIFPHSANFRGKMITLTINHQIKSLPPRLEIKVHENDTAWEMQVAVASRLQALPHSIKIFWGGKELGEKHRTTTLAALGVQEGSAVLVSVKSGSRTPQGKQSTTALSQQTAEARLELDSIPAVTLSQDKKYFELFFKLLDGRHSQKVTEQVWELLMKLPTQPDLKRTIISEQQDWTKALDCQTESVCRLLYTLQILEPAVRSFEMVGSSGSSPATYLADDEYAAWRTQFLSAEGQKALFNSIVEHHGLLLQPSACRFMTKLRQQCLSLLLSLLHSILLSAMVSCGRASVHYGAHAYDFLHSPTALEQLKFEKTESEKKNLYVAKLDAEQGKTILRSVDAGRLQDVIYTVLESCTEIDDGSPRGLKRHLTKTHLVDAQATVSKPVAALWVSSCVCDIAILRSWFERPQFAGFLVELLLCKQSITLRAAVAWGVFSICTQTKKASVDDQENEPLAAFTGMLLDHMPSRSELNTAHSSEHYFQLLHDLINELSTGNAKSGPKAEGSVAASPQDHVGSRSWSKDLIIKLSDRVKRSPVVETHYLTASHESSHREIEDTALIGFLILLKALVAGRADLRRFLGDGSVDGRGMMRELWEECLFNLSGRLHDSAEVSSVPPPRCKTSNARGAAYRLLSEILRHSSDNLAEFLPLLDAQQSCLSSMDEQGNGWDFDPSKEQRSGTGYVGLVNSGCICYMNSLLQQMFMIPSIRRGVLSLQNMEEHKNVPITEEAQDPNSDETKFRLLAQLQQIFSHLLLSERQAYDAQQWTNAYLDEEGRPLNVCIQQDAQEFFTTCCDRLHDVIEKTDQHGLFKKTFMGTLCTQLLCQGGCETARETAAERFMCMTVEVKGQPDLLSSLKHLCEGEILDGVNCDKCGGKRPTVKRDCIGTLPETLFVHLKRFELDFDTFRREKVNDRFEFPVEMNLWPYTKEGLAWKQAHPGEQFPQERGVPTTAYDYELVGVVVHTGGAESGHYYSFIKERFDDQPRAVEEKWFEFNDSIIKPFTLDSLDQECFGGNLNSDGSGKSRMGSEGAQKIRNAYILVYEKKSEAKEMFFDAVSDHKAEQIAGAGHENVVVAVNGSKYCLPRHLCESVWGDNVKNIQNLIFFSREHSTFMLELLKGVNLKDKLDDEPSTDDALSMKLLTMASGYLTGVLAHSTHTTDVAEYLEQLTRLYCRRKRAVIRLLEDCVSDLAPVLSLLLYCPNPTTRRAFAKFLLSLISSLTPDETPILLETELVLPSSPLRSPSRTGQTQPSSRGKRPKALTARFLDALLQPLSIEEVAGSWRHQTDYYWLFHEFASLGPVQREFLISRKVVQIFCDQVLGEYSPLIGPVHVPGTVKRVPDAAIGTPAQYRANWYHNLATVSLLARSCITTPFRNSPKQFIPQTALPPVEGKEYPSLDQWSEECLLTKHLYLIALRHPENWQPVAEIVTHWSFEWEAYSNSVVEVIEDGIGSGHVDGIEHHFKVLRMFLSLQDSFTKVRIERIFHGTTRPGLLNFLKARQLANPRLILVIIVHTIALMKANTQVKDIILGSPARAKELLSWLPGFVAKMIANAKANIYTLAAPSATPTSVSSRTPEKYISTPTLSPQTLLQMAEQSQADLRDITKEAGYDIESYATEEQSVVVVGENLDSKPNSDSLGGGKRTGDGFGEELD